MQWVGVLMLVAFFVGLFVALGREFGFREMAKLWAIVLMAAAWITVGAFLATGRIG